MEAMAALVGALLVVAASVDWAASLAAWLAERRRSAWVAHLAWAAWGLLGASLVLAWGVLLECQVLLSPVQETTTPTELTLPAPSSGRPEREALTR